MTTITNYFRNPSAERDPLSNTISPWGGSMIEASTDEAMFGARSVRVDHTGANGSGLAPTTATGMGGSGRVLTASTYIHAPVGLPLRLSISVVYTDTTAVNIGEVFYVGTGAWARHWVTKTTDATKTLNFVRILITLNGTPAPGSYYVDGMMLTDGDTLPAYFDGDSPNAVWTGTPHASTSVLTLPDTTRTVHPVLKIGSSHIGPLRVGKE